MEHNANDNLPPQTMCRMGCGFYGSQSWDGLCSKCYKDALKRKQNSSPVNGRMSPSVSNTGASSKSPCDDSAPIDRVSATFAQTSLGQDVSTSAPLTTGVHIATDSSHNLETVSSCTTTTSTISLSSNENQHVNSPNLTLSTKPDPSICPSNLVVPPTNSTTATVTDMIETVSTNLESSLENNPDLSTDPVEKKPKKNRCHVCKKKVGLTGFQCRCNGLFCSQHRYSDKHDCSFDYKELAQEQIRKDNPVIKGDKINKI